MLARALTVDPEILVLVEPTSAVDAHTEARIAARLREHRAGRTTVVTTSSPLMLDAVDEVAFLATGGSSRRGTHADLLATEPGVPRRGHPRDRARRGPWRRADEHHAARSPTAGAVRRYVATLARRHPRMLWRAGAARARRPGGAGRAAAARRPGRRPSRPARPSATSTGSSCCWPASWSSQTVLTRYARYLSQVLGEQVLAELREDFVGNALALPVGVVESAGSGDLLTRTSRDVDQLGWSVRMGAARVDDRGRHRRRSPSPPRSASAGGWRCRACSACRRW